MKNFSKNIEYISNASVKHRQLCHASNLMGKWDDNGISGSQRMALSDIIPQYYTYLHENLELFGYDDSTLISRVKLLNEYYNFIHINNFDNVFSSQGKFRSTILEEFMFLLFRDYVGYLKTVYHDTNNVIDSGAAKSYTNLYFTSNNFESFIKSPSIEINVKDQDFAIFRNFTLTANGAISKEIKIPVIAIENKTYIDKTMLEGIISTAEKIKTGNPYAFFAAVTENYDVDLTVDPVYSRIDQIYVLRKSRRKESWNNISPEVVLRLFHEVQSHIERPWSNVEHKMRSDGVIL